MEIDSSSAYIAPTNLAEDSSLALPMFSVGQVELKFPIASDFVAAQVANNVLILALATGRILRIDLDSPSDIDDIDLPKRTSETGLIRRMFLDPSASHLIIATTLGENYYLHTQSRAPKALTRLKGVTIESIAWNPSLPTASTREILVGASDGMIYEVYIEPSNEFFRRERYPKSVYKLQDGPVTGLYVDTIPSRPDHRRVLIASHSKLLHFSGKVPRQGNEGTGSVYTEFFQREAATVHEASRASDTAPSSLVTSPDPVEASPGETTTERVFAWLSSEGVFHGKLLTSGSAAALGSAVFSEGTTFARTQLPASESARGGRKLIQDPISAIALTQWHILCLLEGKIYAINRLDGSIVYEQTVLDPGQSVVGLVADQKNNTFWLFLTQEILEIAITNEDRDIWKIMLKNEQFDSALQYAHGPAEKDAVATASGDYLASKGQYIEAASVYGKSSKPFEQVCLTFIDHGEQDALRKYLLTKLSTYKKSSTMQRTMIACWLVEVFMSKLNSLDDTLNTKAELSENTTTAQTKDEMSAVAADFRDFVNKHKQDIDRKTAYEIITSHGREDELLFYATATNDNNYVLTYWIQREKWTEALDVLKKQTDPEVFYKYSSVLMTHVPVGLVDIMMRQSNLDPRKLVPALLNYNKEIRVSLKQNQAIRYLLFVINNLHSTDAAIHNTLISIYASHPSTEESALLEYLESHDQHGAQPYDADFALRLCIQHNRVQSCVHIYSSMGQYLQAVELALKYDDTDLAAMIADRPDSNPPLRKKLWLAVAKKVIAQDSGIKPAINFLKRCELLKIEDLIPFFPDFVVIDDFKEEICTALEDYSRHIDTLKSEMDSSAATAETIKLDIRSLDMRYAIVEPGEKCWLCNLPLLSRQFFVFPCQHAFHSDCLGKKILEQAGLGKRGRIKDLQKEIGTAVGTRRETLIRELDGFVGEACILCGDYAIKQIDEPFISEADSLEEWAI
ncbi:MAG: hypothetical protein M1834_007998 [Cirrosporium novae-zelandiae]|nr:MAG: hypothetical protein M1834_007998 [Cirrosporium novae-zelandiae]